MQMRPMHQQICQSNSNINNKVLIKIHEYAKTE